MNSALADIASHCCRHSPVQRAFRHTAARLQRSRPSHIYSSYRGHAANTQTRAIAGHIQLAQVASLPRLLDDVVSENTSLLQGILNHPSSVLLGIDPDNKGAVAVVRFGQPGLQPPVHTTLQALSVEVHDIPCIGVVVGKRTRKQADAEAVCALMQRITAESPPGSSFHAVLEEPTPGPMNGRQSVFASAFSFGLWNGILQAHGVALSTISARAWKNDMGLNKQGKDGSRALALALFPTAEPSLRRKKDHGRAEAMLLLAWGLGIRIPKSTLTAKQLAGAEPLTASSCGSDEEGAAGMDDDIHSPAIEAGALKPSLDAVPQELVLLRA